MKLSKSVENYEKTSKDRERVHEKTERKNLEMVMKESKISAAQHNGEAERLLRERKEWNTKGGN